jgi:hypothetical protein
MRKTIFLIAIFTFFSAGNTFGQKRNLVGNLKLKIGAGCGALMWRAGQTENSRKEIFYSSAGDENDTWMNIGGKDIQLKFISRTEPTKTDKSGGEAVGSRTTEIYSARNIKVKIIFTVSWLCVPETPAEGCESVGYTAIFKVSKGKSRQTVRAEGIFGC